MVLVYRSARAIVANDGREPALITGDHLESTTAAFRSLHRWDNGLYVMYLLTRIPQ